MHIHFTLLWLNKQTKPKTRTILSLLLQYDWISEKLIRFLGMRVVKLASKAAVTAHLRLHAALEMRIFPLPTVDEAGNVSGINCLRAAVFTGVEVDVTKVFC